MQGRTRRDGETKNSLGPWDKWAGACQTGELLSNLKFYLFFCWILMLNLFTQLKYFQFLQLNLYYIVTNYIVIF